MCRRLMFVLASLALLARPAFAQRDLKDIPDPDPELERQSFQVAEGFEVNLFAADPRIAKPIQMNFDPQGRLWIASSSIYPHIEPGQEADDRILVVEDLDGDGAADKTSVFARGLLIPTAIEPGDGGAYVANSTEVVHFADTDGDGTADKKRVLLSGFGTEDTHHIIHTFRWGMDGMLYFNQSTYIHSHVETPWGVRRLAGGGIWQFRPETLRLEVFARGFANGWGHHQDEWGQSFATDGAWIDGINYVFPGSVFLLAPGATRILKGLNPGSPKHCGLEILSGTHLPEEWRGNMLTNDFRGHRVCRFAITEAGSGYASRELPELIRTNHVAFRPVDVKMGPDGAIYIADWYNPIIQHGEVDFRDPRRDRTHGRIWRVTAKGRPLAKRTHLAGAAVPSLLEALKSPEPFTRQQAKRVLKERGSAQVMPLLARWFDALDPGDAQFQHQRVEALWTCQSLDVTEPRILSAVLQSPDHRARAAAVRVLSAWHERVPEALETLGRAVHDEHPRVRLEAVRALAQIPRARAAEVALQALDHPVDSNLDFALWQTARDLQAHWLPAVGRDEVDFDGHVERLLFALQAADTPAVVPPLVRLLNSGKIPAAREADALTQIASLGGPDELRLVYELALAEARRPERLPVAVKLFSTLNHVAQSRKVQPAGDLSGLAEVIGLDGELDATVFRTIGLWNVESLRPRLEGLVLAARELTPTARGAIDGLALLGGGEATLAKLASDRARPEPLRIAAVTALAGSDLPAATHWTIDLLSGNPSADDLTALFAALWQQRNGPAEFVRTLGTARLSEAHSKLAIRTARTSGRELGELIEVLARAGGLSSGTKELSPQEMQQFVAAVRERGDPQRGEQIYRRADQVCVKCHAIAGAGGQVGPDLSSLGASAPIDYLIDSLLLPNKAIKENYHSLVVETEAGKIISGVKVRQTEHDLVLRNADDQEVAIPVRQIVEQSNGGSIMPAGLTETLSRSELVDLVRFLSELGKLGAYAPSQARVARTWQALDPAATNAMIRDPAVVGVTQLALSDPGAIARIPGLAWSPVYSRVSGALPVNELPVVESPGGTARICLVRCGIVVTTPGPVNLAVNSSDGLSCWINGVSVELAPEAPLNLKNGWHTVHFRIDLSQRSDELRVALTDVPGSPAQARFVGGK